MSCLPKNTNDALHWPKVILYGDSLTQYSFDPELGCWGAMLMNKLRRRCDVVNRGLSGYNSNEAFHFLPKLFAAENFNPNHVACFVLMIGTNDAVFCDKSSDQVIVPHTKYHENLRGIMRYIFKLGLEKEKIILMTPPPLHFKSYEKFCLNQGRNAWNYLEIMDKYSSQCVAIGKEFGVEVVPLYESITSKLEWHTMFNDGLHFNKDGAQHVFNQLWPRVEKRVADLPYMFPHYSQLNDFSLQRHIFQAKDKNDNFK